MMDSGYPLIDYFFLVFQIIFCIVLLLALNKMFHPVRSAISLFKWIHKKFAISLQHASKFILALFNTNNFRFFKKNFKKICLAIITICLILITLKILGVLNQRIY